MGKIVEFNKFQSKRNHTMSQDTKNLYILIGIPASGKSTYVDNILLKKANIVVVATDEIRKELTGTYKFSLESNKNVFEIAKEKIHKALSQGFDVVFDATNTNKQYRNGIIKIAQRNNSIAHAIV